jgi:hypothetical protein
VTESYGGQPPEWADDDRDGMGHRPGPGSRVLDGLSPVIVFTGSRAGWDEDELRKLIAAKLDHVPWGTWSMHGGSGQVDQTAQAEAMRRALPTFVVPYISKLGKAGGPERNSVMAYAAHSLSIAGHVVQVCAMWAGHTGHCDPMGGEPANGTFVECHCGTRHMAGMADMLGLDVTYVLPGPLVFRDGDRPPDIFASGA